MRNAFWVCVFYLLCMALMFAACSGTGCIPAMVQQGSRAFIQCGLPALKKEASQAYENVKDILTKGDADWRKQLKELPGVTLDAIYCAVGQVLASPPRMAALAPGKVEDEHTRALQFLMEANVQPTGFAYPVAPAPK